MNNKMRRRAVFEEPSFWQSFSDMMSALTLVFILIIAITLAIYRQKTTDLEHTQTELNAAKLELDTAKSNLDLARIDLDRYRDEIEASNRELEDSLAELRSAYEQAELTQEELEAAYRQIEVSQQEIEVTKLQIAAAQQELADTRSELQDIVGIRTDIIGELQSRFNNSSMTVDSQTGSITFSSDVLFQYNSSELTDDSESVLKEIIPMYLGVLLQDNYLPYIAEIIIEGHTDTIGSYDSNMALSFNRADSVAKFCMDSGNGLTADQISQLQRLLTVNGRSYSDPIYEAPERVDMAASRRVEIKFRLKEDEMIERIAQVLAGQEGQENTAGPGQENAAGPAEQ